ncbi:MAG: DUF3299 domain-containing protein [Pseudobdellovibrionaceae bacterium]
MKIVAIVGSFVLSAVAAYFLIGRFSSGSFGTPAATEIEWRTLTGLDYVTGQTSEELKNLNGKVIRMPGFMVPLEDNQKIVKEFLLVPTAQACIHVPPPPPNQMVLVRMEEGKGTEVQYGPIWIYGILKVETDTTVYGAVSFQLTGTYIEPFKF